MKIKELIDVDGTIQNPQTGEIIKKSMTSDLFAWKPNGGGRKAAIIVSKLATNRARINRMIGESSEYAQARDEIVKKYQIKTEGGGWEWVGGDEALLNEIAETKTRIEQADAKAKTGITTIGIDEVKAKLADLERERAKLQAQSAQAVNSAIMELVEHEAVVEFEKVDLGDLFDFGCVLSAEQVGALSFMLDTSTLEPAPTA